MKKVAEVADDLGVSRVTVYNHIKRLSKEIKDNVYSEEGVKVIDNKGFLMIKASIEGKDDLKFYLKENSKKEEDYHSDREKEALKELKETLKEEIERLEKELEVKNEQINRLNGQLESFHMMIRSKEEKIYQLEGEVEEQNKSIIDKFKDFFSNNHS